MINEGGRNRYTAYVTLTNEQLSVHVYLQEASHNDDYD